MLSSSQNPSIKEALKLNKRRERDATGRFLIEGYRELTRAAAGNVVVRTLFICPPLFLGSNEQHLIATLQKKNPSLHLLPCSESLFHKISYRDRPDGLLAIADQWHICLETLIPPAQAPLYLIAEGIEKPGNLGTILRSADGSGASGVFVCDKRTDLFNPNVVRASVGTLFTQPTVQTHSELLFTWLKQQQIHIVAASPNASLCYTDADFSQPLAILVGSEQYGLTPFWMQRADQQVFIPMQGVADSLNVAMATTLLLYEVARQRRVSINHGNHLLR